ncbi:pyruvate dehydrogenase complex dihydrolipoamide acetyltransferase [Portibacter lacus]|uniref:Acetyltransferase component of pyruvate dehydrogenase complex n=1 Tax=Portibacter lacus TaxID=1099794 RepID=A0AA37WEZ9_9BACT|nr:pyruvate dehydrogenase complex dihydrolipoamide acetyltransferase [Portibacter lacus]GLR19361.1 dihydrolipoamide acetyltransferase component of pyruvate dehydrogenase complex [Portibacter lacus]
MADVIRMPRMSDTMEEGNIVEWLKKVGDEVEPGDVLAEVETDKATMELESYQDGVLLYIGVESGPVPVNGILAVIGEKGEDYKPALAAAESSSEGEQKEEPTDNADSAAKTESVSESSDTKTSDDSKGQSASDDSRIKSSPLARSMAKEYDINLKNIEGSGENNRIIKKDIEEYIASGKGKQAKTESVNIPVIESGLADFEYGDHPVSQMRKTIARRLAESKYSAPHFYLTIAIDMDNAIKSRKSINENSETRISFNDFVVKASALALRKHPSINASWFGDKITYHKEINVGVAVAVADGLLVPVINNADYKSLSSINGEVKELAGKAKTKKLQPKEMQGNTFTISNLGMFDIEEFTAIINPPDSCILAIGSIKKIPVVKDGAVVPGNVMKVTLSCDHRVVDGASGAQFLATFKSYLENPVMMLV